METSPVMLLTLALVPKEFSVLPKYGWSLSVSPSVVAAGVVFGKGWLVALAVGDTDDVGLLSAGLVVGERVAFWSLKLVSDMVFSPLWVLVWVSEGIGLTCPEP